MPALSRGPHERARASALASTSPYGRLVIAQRGINVRIRSHQIGVNSPGSGTPNLSPMTVVKSIDAATLALLEDITKGVHLSEVVVRVFKPNSTDPRIIYTLEDVVVTDLQHGGLVESLSFQYQKITIEVGANSYCYDVAQNQEC
jgi:type VI protein secretion system component Hcp